MIASQAAQCAKIESGDLVSALQSGLAKHFETVTVEAVECPDLSSIGVASSGMCGESSLL